MSLKCLYVFPSAVPMAKCLERRQPHCLSTNWASVPFTKLSQFMKENSKLTLLMSARGLQMYTIRLDMPVFLTNARAKDGLFFPSVLSSRFSSQHLSVADFDSKLKCCLHDHYSYNIFSPRLVTLSSYGHGRNKEDREMTSKGPSIWTRPSAACWFTRSLVSMPVLDPAL